MSYFDLADGASTPNLWPTSHKPIWPHGSSFIGIWGWELSLLGECICDQWPRTDVSTCCADWFHNLKLIRPLEIWVSWMAELITWLQLLSLLAEQASGLQHIEVQWGSGYWISLAPWARGERERLRGKPRFCVCFKRDSSAGKAVHKWVLCEELTKVFRRESVCESVSYM